ncbi:[Pyruvate dehydrogenase (acetyl-transferring)] kinase, mitochondrial [Araneus ventricosus]|uniref:Protein-serine/threonine kinase n=1 Tax=Araneus ventricosus TaxID=182803 RepID=A0A4Y2NWK2_ARAVE|nr:[Pyruvate dehydrogenase (acetyl-transferring)] kinase, mitochondrial [Araneus ventricosus]
MLLGRRVNSLPPARLTIDSNLSNRKMAGYGYGLPLSRLYARYLQGDLIVTSAEGHGTDAIIYLKALSDEANELLPVFNKTSSRHYRATVGTHDWSTQNQTMGVRQLTTFNDKRRISAS